MYEVQLASSPFKRKCVHACILSRVRLFATLYTVAHQAPLSMQFSRQEYWNGLPFPTPGTFLTQGSNPHVLCLLSLAGGFFITVPPWKPYYIASFHNFCTECFPHTFYLKLEFTKDTSLLVAHQTPIFSPYPVD